MKWDWSKLEPFVKAVKTACDAGALGAGQAIAADVRKHFARSGRYKSSPPGGPPNMRREGLRNSIQAALARPMVAKIGSTLAYAHVHETGKTIVAGAKLLQVPLNEYAARQSEKGGIKTTPGGVRFIRAGRKLLAIGGVKTNAPQSIRGANGKTKTVSPKGVPVWLLVRTVRIPKRPFMRPGLERAKTNPQVFEGFAKGVNAGLRKAGFKTKVVRG